MRLRKLASHSLPNVDVLIHWERCDYCCCCYAAHQQWEQIVRASNQMKTLLHLMTLTGRSLVLVEYVINSIILVVQYLELFVLFRTKAATDSIDLSNRLVHLIQL